MIGVFSPTISLGAVLIGLGIIATVFQIRAQWSSVQQNVIDSLRVDNENLRRSLLEQKNSHDREMVANNLIVAELRARIQHLEDTNVEALMVEMRQAREEDKRWNLEFKEAFSSILTGLEALRAA